MPAFNSLLPVDMAALAAARNHHYTDAPQFAEQFIGHLGNYRSVYTNWGAANVQPPPSPPTSRNRRGGIMPRGRTDDHLPA